MIGIRGDTVPESAIVDGKIAYAYVACFGGKAKCAGYATPKAHELLALDGYEVTVRYFDNGVEIPNLIDYQ
jgi:hypothetical protein